MVATTLKPLRLIAGAFLCVAAVTATVGAEPAYSVRNNGASSNRVDIAIMGDGYTAGELGKFAEDAERMLAVMFDEEPFRTYRAYFNVHRVDVVSAESGADHPMSSVFRDTALGSFYDCAGITRMICVDHGRINDVLQVSLDPEQRDIVLILVNDPEYGGSGGSVAVASLDPAVVEVVLHELGHTLGLLADEYEYVTPDCWTWFEPAAPNVTTETDRARIKWAPWIAPSTEIPTFSSAEDVPGLYEGAEYCWTGKYRATYDSKMRSLYRPFEAVNVEQLTKRIYTFVSPVDSAGQRKTRGHGNALRFYVRTPSPASHKLRIRWELDGKFLSNRAEVRLNRRRLRGGEHELRVTVWDPTTTVRTDPDGLLKDTRSWRINRRTGRTPHAIRKSSR